MSSIGQGSISIDDSTRIGEGAQDTANEAAGNVNDINSDNKLTPSEKLKLKQEYDKDVELYNIDIEQLKSVDLPTAELETAMSNLTDFVTPLFKEMNRTSAIDRDALDSVFTAFATADKNASQAFVNMVQQVADDAKKAGDDAKEAGEKAQEAGEEAKASADQAKADATQAKADAATAQQKAQSSIDQLNEATTKFDGEITDAKNSAQQALDNITVVDSKVTNLSTSTTAQFNTLNNGYQEVISTVNNMDIGARNYLLNSNVTTNSFLKLNASTPTSFFSNKKIVISVEIEIKNLKTVSDASNNRVGYEAILVDKDGKSYYPGVWKLFSKADIGKSFQLRINNYFDFSNTVFKDNSSNDCGALYVQGITADVVKVGKPKLEIGNKATDWSPAPEDLASQTQITTLNNLIDQKVSNDQYQSDKTQTADLISQTVTNAVNNINVGGRNYILNSDFYITSGQKNVLSSVEPNEYSGKKITVSVDIEINNLKTIADSGYTRVGYEASFHASDNSTVYVGVWKNLTKSDIGKSFKYRAINNTYDLTKKTITSINDGNGALGGVYIQGITADSIKVGHPKLEITTKATDWSPAPEDLATITEIDQINNEIKLKANSSDVTSQINVAIKGVQTDVTNKVSSLTTQINQTSDAVQILASTVGSKNLVYNATFEQMTSGFPAGWTKSNNTSNETGYVSGVPVSSYQGRHSIGVNTSKEMGWVMFAQSDPQPLPVDNSTDATNNVYSASMMVKVYGDGGAKPNGHVHVVLAFFDANKKRIENDIKGVWSKTATESKEQWHLVKVEGLTPVASAKYVAIQAFAYGVPTHAMINQPMVNIGATVQPFKSDMVNQASITASINNINLKVSNSDGSSSQVNINNNTILLDANKIIFSGNTSIQNGTIGTAKIANAAINTAQIADGAINNAKIANAAINDAKISNLNGNKIVAGSITANKINVNDLIANGINTKTLTSVNLNTSTLTTPKLNLGLNGTFTEDFDYTQATTMFLPKKNKGTLTFNHGVLQSKGNMQTYVGGKWGGMNDNYTFQAGIDNSQWTEVAPGYIKLDLFKQNDADVAERTYIDPTGYYYTSRNGIATYLGNVLQVSQVQTPSVFAKYIGPSDGELRLQIGSNGSHYGLQVGSYAGKEAVLSDFIYSATSSASPDIHITENGHLVRTTSASKYKYNIKNPEIETTLGDRLLNVHLATWNDKRAVDLYAEQLSTGEEREISSIDEYYGLIAEQLRDAGLDMFINYGKNHEIEGIQYDRAWLPLLSVIRRLNNKVNEYELRISKLEGKINE